MQSPIVTKCSKRGPKPGLIVFPDVRLEPTTNHGFRVTNEERRWLEQTAKSLGNGCTVADIIRTGIAWAQRIKHNRGVVGLRAEVDKTRKGRYGRTERQTGQEFFGTESAEDGTPELGNCEHVPSSTN